MSLRSVLLVLMLALLPLCGLAETEFTYQGMLKFGGVPANGVYDFKFSLYNGLSVLQSPPLAVNDVTVTNGLFAASLDFGNLFDGTPRLLGIEVRPGASTGAYTALEPRQRLTAAPMAIYADTAGTATSAWNLGGNFGTDPATQFLGTRDNTILVLRTNNTVGLRLQPYSSSVSVVGGNANNTVDPYVESGVIAGGKNNWVADSYDVVGGGYNNHAGVRDNTTYGVYATVAGGGNNVAGGEKATVGGGGGNAATGYGATIAGGLDNQCTAYAGAIAGGCANTVNGDYGFAAGQHARVAHKGCFVWNDASNGNEDYISQRDNQVKMRAEGGMLLEIGNGSWVNLWGNTGSTRIIDTSPGAYLTTGGVWQNASDRNLKEHFTPVDRAAVLRTVAALPITTWNYKAEGADIRHLGPMAQDFHAAFGLGDSDKAIGTVDEAGVALAAIQGLCAENAALKAQVDNLQTRLARLEAMLAPPAQ